MDERQPTPLSDALDNMAETLRQRDGRQWSLFNDAPLPDDERAGEARPKGIGAGRPPGARNKQTEQFRAWVRSRHGDPGLELMKRIFTDPKALAAALRAPTPWDVYKAQSEWLLRLMPYFWAAMPAELKVQSRGALALAVSGVPGGLPGGDRLVDDDPFAALMKIATGQALNDVEAEPSNDAPSNDQALLPDRSKA